MDRTITATVDASPAATITALSDLGTYPVWLTLVRAADPETPAGEQAAWIVTLRARLGPLARSKRLRMVRTALDDRMVRFERQELDGRSHADWILSATVAPRGENRCDADVHLHYSGALWSTPLEVALAGYERSAADRLGDFLSGN